MSFRLPPETIDEIVAQIQEELRRAQTDLVTVRVVTDHGGLAGLDDDDHDQYQLREEQGVAEGYPSLDGTGKVPKPQLPADVVYTGDLPDVTDVELLAWLAMTEA